MKYIYLALIFTIVFLSSCVSTKQYEEQTALASKYLAQKEDCNESLSLAETKLEEALGDISNLENENKLLKESTLQQKKSIDNLKTLAAEEKSLKDIANQEYENYMKSSSKKQEDLTKKLAEKERTLSKKEGKLESLKTNLDNREKELNQIKKELAEKESNLNIIQTDLKQKSLRVGELETKLNAQSEAMNNLKTNISSALKDFTSEELTVEEKEGKIYVSLSEKLLFKSGSFTLDKNGESAIIKLAEVLQKQKDVNIIVEGHTDSDAFSGKGDLKDNWDLSVKRATSVVRVLVANNVAKNKVTASGRGANMPVAENKDKEGKAKNRRTEIILAPQLDKLFELIQAK